MLVGSFFGAVNALGISILGEYVIRIYDQVRGRPLYLIERTRNLATADSAPAVPAAAIKPVAAARPPNSIAKSCWPMPSRWWN